MDTCTPVDRNETRTEKKSFVTKGGPLVSEKKKKFRSRTEEDVNRDYMIPCHFQHSVVLVLWSVTLSFVVGET